MMRQDRFTQQAQEVLAASQENSSVVGADLQVGPGQTPACRTGR